MTHLSNTSRINSDTPPRGIVQRKSDCFLLRYLPWASVFLLWLTLTITLHAQTTTPTVELRKDSLFTNPSFEKVGADNNYGWAACGGGGYYLLPAANYPASWGSTLAATDGSNYAGLLSANQINNAISQKLKYPLLPGRTYKFTLDIACAPKFIADAWVAGDQTNTFNKPSGFATLKIYYSNAGNNISCAFPTLLWQKTYTNESWQKDVITLTNTTNRAITHLKFQCTQATPNTRTGLLIDNLRTMEGLTLLNKQQQALAGGKEFKIYWQPVSASCPPNGLTNPSLKGSLTTSPEGRVSIPKPLQVTDAKGFYLLKEAMPLAGSDTLFYGLYVRNTVVQGKKDDTLRAMYDPSRTYGKQSDLLLDNLAPLNVKRTSEVDFPIDGSVCITVLDADGKRINSTTDFKVYTVLDGVETPLVNPSSNANAWATSSCGTICIDLPLLGSHDVIKVEKVVHQEPHIRGFTDFKNEYRIVIDNGTFESSTRLVYQNWKQKPRVELSHTEVRCNVLATVQWDADAGYLNSLQNAFKEVSQFMYDYSDGQVRLDTVVVYDNNRKEDQTVIKFYANNNTTPTAPYGELIGDPPAATYGAYKLRISNRNTFDFIRFPRKLWRSVPSGGLVNDTRGSVLEPYPYDLTTKNNVRTIGHELGHFLFGFVDEYGIENQNPGINRFGLMDLQEIDDIVVPGGLPGHEMSSDQVYLNLPNELSDQKKVRGTSCWGTFEYLFEKEFNGIKANIVKPSERDPALLTNALYFSGPSLNVKDKVTVTIVDEFTLAAVKMLQFLTYENSQYDTIQIGRRAVVKKKNGDIIEQGIISSLDGGRLLGLGLNDGDVISATQEGFAGKRVFDSSSPEDPFLITLERLAADNSNPASRTENTPLAIVNTLAFSSTGALNYAHYSNSHAPVFDKVSVSSLKSSFSLGAVTLPTEALSSGNTLALEGKDGSGVPFIHGISYQYLKGGKLKNKKAFQNESGDQFVPSAATQAALKKFILASSDFPPLLAGISGQSRKVSQVVSVDAFPNKVFAGTLLFKLDAVEKDQQYDVYKWNADKRSWERQSSDFEVNDDLNACAVKVSSPGTYALFAAATDNNKDEVSLPSKHFSVYPNPFSNEITISPLAEAKVRSVKILNGAGLEVVKVKVAAGKLERVRVNVEGLADGTYFILVIDDKGGQTTTKAVKVK